MNRDILGFLFLVLAIVVGVLFFVPKVQEVHTITTDKKAKTALTDSRKARLTALQQVQTLFAQQPDRIKKLSAVLPAQPQIPEVLVSLEAMAKESNVVLTSIVPQVSTKDQSVFATMVGQGDLASVEKLSLLIADNSRPMSIRAISMSKTQDGKAISFTLTIRAPYTDANATAAAAASGGI
jgi:Tfp pilus assembly protein PilO